jgi:hypothetical protein
VDRFEQFGTGTLELTIRDGGVLVESTAAVTVSIYDGTGALVVTNAATTHPSAGLYRYAVPAAVLALLDGFRVEWKYAYGGEARTKWKRFMTVGSFYCTIDDLRNFGQNKTLASEIDFPPQLLIDKRELAEELLERECDTAFSPQGKRLVLGGNDRRILEVPLRDLRRVVSGRIDAVAMTGDQVGELVVYPTQIVRPSSWPGGMRNVELYIERGWDEPPEDIKEATMMIVRDRVEQKDLSDERATSLTNDQGTMRIQQPDEDHPTGIPYVDSVIRRYAEDDEIGSIPIVSGYRS